jgi:TolB-like protein
VLPLENLSEEAENAFFADGIHDDILTRLSKIKQLKVISRSERAAIQAGAARDLGASGNSSPSRTWWKEVCAGPAIACW